MFARLHNAYATDFLLYHCLLHSCQYIAKLINVKMSTEAVCMCDDDNDIEMALACAQAYIPALTSTSLQKAINKHPNHFVQTFHEKANNTLPTIATDEALRLIIKRALTKPFESQLHP